MNEEKREKIWEEIREVIKTTYITSKLDNRLPEEKTTKELMEFFGMSRDATTSRLDWLVEQGILLKRRGGRNNCLLFRPNPDFNIDSTKHREE